MYLPPQSTIEINGTVFLFFTTIQGYGDELMKVHFTPKEPLISIGDQQSFWTFDKYWDGDNFYWDSSCSQKVVYGCDKSIYHPGYFFDGWDYYSDYQCIYQVDLY